MSADLVLPLAADLLLKSSAVLVLTWAILKAWRHASASQRACLWCVAFGLIALLPLTRLVAPHWVVAFAKAKASVESSATMVASETDAVPLGEVASVPLAPGWEMPDGVTLGVSAWLAGVFVLLGYRGTGAFLLRRCRGASLPLKNETGAVVADAIRAEIGIARGVELRVSLECRMPVTWGTWQPVVVLPIEATTWPQEWLESALRHELAHVRNFDHLKRLIVFSISAAYWPNPLVWMAAKQLQLAQEEASDNFVPRADASAQDYATQLVALIQLGAGRRVLSFSGVAMARSSTLEGRLAALLDETRNRRRADGRLLSMVAGFALVVGLALGAVQLRAADQAQPAPAVKPGIATLQQKLKSIVLDRVVFNKTDVAEVIQFLQRKSKEADPAHEGVNFVLRLKSDAQEVPTIHTEVTLDLASVSMEKVLDEIARQTNLEYWVEDYAVYLRPAGDGAAVLSVRTYLVPSGLFKAVTPGAGATDDAARVDVKTQLGNLGFRFSAGATATYLPGPNKLVVRDTVEQLDALAELMAKMSAAEAASPKLWERTFYLSDKAAHALQIEAGTQGDVSAALEKRGIDFQEGAFALLRPKDELDVKNAYPEMLKLQALLMAAAPEDWHDAVSAEGASAPHAANDAGDQALAAKVKSIVLDKVNINQMDVAQVLQLLAAKTRELDPAQKGIHFVLGNITPADHVHRPVSVTLENVPLEDVLGYITTQTNLQCTIKGGAVVFAPAPQKANPPGTARSSQLDPKTAGEAIWFTADGANDVEGNVVKADDNAVCHFHGCALAADHLTYNRVTKVLTGTGHATLVGAKGNSVLGYQIIVPECDEPLGRYYVMSKPGA